MDRTPYPAALRLYVIAEERWAEIDAAYLNVDLLRVPPFRFCNAVYAWCLERVDPEKREQWIAGLSAPLPGQEDTVSDNVIEEEGAAFMAAMQMHQQNKGK